MKSLRGLLFPGIALRLSRLSRYSRLQDRYRRKSFPRYASRLSSSPTVVLNQKFSEHPGVVSTEHHGPGEDRPRRARTPIIQCSEQFYPACSSVLSLSPHSMNRGHLWWRSVHVPPTKTLESWEGCCFSLVGDVARHLLVLRTRISQQYISSRTIISSPSVSFLPLQADPSGGIA